MILFCHKNPLRHRRTRLRRHTRRFMPTPQAVHRWDVRTGVPGWGSLLPVWLSRARHRPAIVAAMSGTANDDRNQAEARAPISKEDTRRPSLSADIETRHRQRSHRQR